MSNKIKIQLKPYDAMAILSFLREFLNEDNINEPELQAMHEAVLNYENEILNNTTEKHLQEVEIENIKNRAFGRCPDNYKNES